MIVTHQDTDHSGGALSLLQTVPVDWLASSLPADHAILAQRAPTAASPLRCDAGQRWEWDGVRFAILQPPPSLYAAPRVKPNDLSCVVRVDSDHGSVLLTGDLEARGELDLVRRDRGCAQGGRAARAAPRQPHVVDAGVHRRGRARDRRLHARLPQPLRPSAAGGRRALRRRRRADAIAPITTAR